MVVKMVSLRLTPQYQKSDEFEGYKDTYLSDDLWGREKDRSFELERAVSKGWELSS